MAFKNFKDAKFPKHVCGIATKTDDQQNMVYNEVLTMMGIADLDVLLQLASFQGTPKIFTLKMTN